MATCSVSPHLGILHPLTMKGRQMSTMKGRQMSTKYSGFDAIANLLVKDGAAHVRQLQRLVECCANVERGKTPAKIKLANCFLATVRYHHDHNT